MDKQPKGWIQPAKQAFFRPPGMPASQLLDKPSPAHQSAKQTADAVGKEKKVSLSLVDRVYSLFQGSSAQETIEPL